MVLVKPSTRVRLAVDIGTAAGEGGHDAEAGEVALVLLGLLRMLGEGDGTCEVSRPMMPMRMSGGVPLFSPAAAGDAKERRAARAIMARSVFMDESSEGVSGAIIRVAGAAGKGEGRLRCLRLAPARRGKGHIALPTASGA